MVDEPLIPGNIDLPNLPIVRHPNGSIESSPYFLLGIGGGRQAIIPTFNENGKILSNGDAIDQYKATGKHFGIFESEESASAYAQKLFDRQVDGAPTPTETASSLAAAPGQNPYFSTPTYGNSPSAYVHADAFLFLAIYGFGMCGLIIVLTKVLPTLKGRIIRFYDWLHRLSALKTVKATFHAQRVPEEIWYAQAAREVRSGQIHDGLWTKAWSQTQGDNTKAQALYLKLRADAIRAEAVQKYKTTL